MKERQQNSRLEGRARLGLLGLVTLGLVLGTVAAYGQDYRSFQSTENRVGRATIQPTTGVAETVWNNAGRGFLRWWDPIFDSDITVDNDAVTTVPAPLASWIDPAPVGLPTPNIYLASGYYTTLLVAPPYRVAVTSTVGGNEGNPTLGATASYQHTIAGLVPGETYEIQVNLPIGPTNITPGGATDLRFTPHYQLYRVNDANGNDDQWVDLLVNGGGWATVANGKRYVCPASGQISVTLYNVVQRNSFGTQIDPQDNPGFDVVIADAVRAVAKGVEADGSYTASPVVGQLTQTPYLGGLPVFNQRVVAARNEFPFFGSLNREVRFGEVTSFTHNGAPVNPLPQPLRRNMVWSWPAVRPNDLSQAEKDRYAVERQNWAMGGPANYPRHATFRQADDLSSSTTVGGLFAPTNVFNHIGPTYLETPVVAVNASFVNWQPPALPGNYFIDVYFPNDDPGNTLARGATYQVLQGVTVVATFSVDQNTLNNWVRIPNQPTAGFAHTQAQPLSVRLLDTSTNANDVPAARNVFADAVRFVGQADLGIESTPAQVSVNVHDGVAVTPRDVVVVARENGHIYCMDAHGDVATGAQPRVYWTWPSEDPATDPNNAPLEDYGISETPTKFNMSSVLVANIGGADLVFIGSDNGRVYCLEMQGRGDGTTRRRWTYPDDFDPSNPNNPMGTTNLGPIKGSLSLATVAGNPAIIVPASSGRIIAIDAAGNPATRTTPELWRYPALPNPPLGEIAMAPVVAGGQIFFSAADAGAPTQGVIHALDPNTGAANWIRQFRADNVTPLGLSGSSSPLYLPNTVAPQNQVTFVDGGGYITTFDAATGNVLWEETTVPGGATGSLSFAYLRTYNPAGTVMTNAVPSILVPANSGDMLGFYADGSVNIVGNRLNWGYSLEGLSHKASFAVGGWPNSLALLGNRTHIYTGDSDGYLYAFASEDDTDTAPPFTPGGRPGRPNNGANNPNQAALNAMITSDDVVLLTPAQFRDLQNKAKSAAGIAYADVTALKANPVLRRDFEYGERVYIGVLNIDDTTVAATSGYSVRAELSSNNRTIRADMARNIQLYDVTGAPSPQEGAVAFVSVTLNPIGRDALPPGNVSLNVRAMAAGNRAQGTPIALSVTPNSDPVSPIPAGPDFRIANPFGIAFVDAANAVTNAAAHNVINPTDPLVFGNGTLGNSVNVTMSPWNKWEDGALLPPIATRLSGGLLSNDVGATSAVPHASTGRGRMMVYDRSLMAMATGRAMGNVQIRPTDLAWQPVTFPVPVGFNAATDLGVYKPLPATYAGFEDYPSQYPNVSLDYPDLNRNRLKVSKSTFGVSENPLFGGVTLSGPIYTPADLTNYETTGYEAGLTRSLQATPFEIQWDIPRYQPATQSGGARPFGYSGKQTLFVDSGNPGFQNEDAFRQFTLGTSVAVDEHVSTGTKTLDLGSTPAGGGFNGGVAGGPIAPWLGASLFRPWDPAFNAGTNAQYQQFSVFNEGNSNLLNVRLSKAFGKISGVTQIERPLELYAPGQHELAWLDGGWNMFSDLDPLLSPTARAGFAPGGEIALQKPRPGDVSAVRMSTNPRRRANPNTGVSSGNLLNPATFPVGDPYVGVAPPIGTPVGSYIRQIYPFEDYGQNADPNIPVLGFGTSWDGFANQAEPFANPGFTLKFNVRETRLTNRATTKAAPSVDNLIAGTEPHVWGNRQPSVMRMDNGSVFTTWSSNRMDAGNLPNFAARAKLPADAAAQEQWRIFVSSLEGSVPTGTQGQSPLNDFNAWVSANANRWFQHSLVFPANGTWQPLFTLAAGENLLAPGDETSARFMYPTFPNSGFENPLVNANAGRSSIPDRYMAFVGETTKVDRTGAPSKLSQIMLAALNYQPNGAVALNGITALPFDTTSAKGKPSLVQTDNNNASVYYVGTSNGLGELYTSWFNGNTWSQVRGLGLGDQFENLGAPSVSLRRYRNAGASQVADVFFTGKVRGRSNAEAFTGQLSVDANGAPVGREPWRTLVDRFDRLEYDTASGTFWAPGVDWRMNDADITNFKVLMRQGNALVNIVDNTPQARKIDRDAREMVFTTTKGGQCFVDTLRGSVKFTGAILPRNAQIFVSYSPKFVRVSGTTSAFVIDDNGTARIARANVSRGANYRSASGVFDERYLGVYIRPEANRQDQNLTEDGNFWFDQNNLPVTSVFQVRNDRYWLAMNRTSNDGSAATRPFISTLRFGVDLPAPVAVDQNGIPLNFQVDFSLAALGGLEAPFYQIDPANGRVYFTAPMEDQPVIVRYTGVDGNGNLLVNLRVDATVGMVPESGEQAVPIEQASNESDISLALDPRSQLPLLQRRPSTLWMVWTSMRNGTPDVFFQTIAPKTAPQLPRP